MKKSLLSLGLAALIMGLHGTAFAAYQSDSDTGANALDYIENKRRAERENALTDEQKKLLEDAAFIKEHLREPLDSTKNVPTTFEGDDLVYDQNTGEFKATGKVHIVQMDAHQFDAVDGDAHGNTIKQELIDQVVEEAYVEASSKYNFDRLFSELSQVYDSLR